jgi:hypothetical protein
VGSAVLEEMVSKNLDVKAQQNGEIIFRRFSEIQAKYLRLPFGWKLMIAGSQANRFVKSLPPGSEVRWSDVQVRLHSGGAWERDPPWSNARQR